MTFRKSKLIDNRPSLALNFHGNIETWCSYRQILCSVGDCWTHSEKKTSRGRKSLSPSVRDKCCLCVKFGSQGIIIIRTENLFQPSKQTGSFDVILAKLYEWKWWIANRILRAEDRSDWVSGGCHFSNLWHNCGDSFHAFQCPKVSGVERKIYERSLQALLSLPHHPLSRLLLYASHASTFHNIPKWRACSQATVLTDWLTSWLITCWPAKLLDNCLDWLYDKLADHVLTS